MRDIRILLIEDDACDALLMDRELRKGGLDFESSRIETESEFLAALENHPPDLILSDHGLPCFDGFSALAIAREKAPDVPFIFVTGSLGEEMTIRALKSGATDYVLKHHLSNLVPAIHRALREGEERTRRRLAEAALRRSEERFRHLVQGVKDYAIYMLDPDGRILTWSAGLESIEGYRPDEIVDQHFSRFYLPDDIESGLPEKDLRKAAKEERLETEGWRLRKDGNRYWAHVLLTALRDERGKLYGFSNILCDRTESKRAEEALQKSEERYRRLFELCPDALLVISEQKVIFVNRAAVGLFAAENCAGLIGKPFAELVHKKDWPKVSTRLAKPADERNQTFIELKVRRSDGSLVDVELAATALPFNDQPAVQVIIHDITERKLAQEKILELNSDLEQRVQQRTKELEAANKELEAFSFSVSHDLRAPLRHIQGFVEILQRAPTPAVNEECRGYVDTIGASATQMSRLIDDLLAFSRMGRTDLLSTRIPLDDLIAKIRQELQLDTKTRKIDWVVNDLPCVEGDPATLKQVLINLLSNAVKYTSKRPQARIEIGSSETENEHVIFVRDNGVGFDPRYSHKLFGVFQRLHSTRDFDGTGIGLAIVRTVVSRHGGRTWAEGEPGKGATFYVSLPKNCSR